MEFSSMDLYFLTKEFQNEINSRIENFYLEKNNKIFYIKFYNSNNNKSRFFTMKVPKYILINDEKGKTEEPTSFIFHLRKKLNNAILREIKQIEDERILKFVFSKKQIEDKKERIVEYFLYIELFSIGNIILTDSDNIILNSIITKNFRDRSIRTKRTYLFPPRSEKDYSLDISLIKFLSRNLSLGGKFSEEILFRLNFDKNKKVNELNENEIFILEKSIEKLRNEKINAKICENGFYPIDFLSKSNCECESFSSFNDCLINYFKNFYLNKKDEKEISFENELLRLKKIYDKQLEQKKEIEFEAENLSNIGNKIYENYELIENILRTRTNEKIIKKIDLKNNFLEVEL
jgi:predicted ribosome quality control (RQC) complex YloA/Tae2 family protein